MQILGELSGVGSTVDRWGVVGSREISRREDSEEESLGASLRFVYPMYSPISTLRAFVESRLSGRMGRDWGVPG